MDCDYDSVVVIKLLNNIINLYLLIWDIPLQIKKELNAVRKRMKKELKRAEIRATNRMLRLFGKQNQTYVGKLEFRNKISETILTGEEIKGEGHTCLEVALTDNNTGHVVDTGPQSSASVEIVVLKGEFDACEGDTEFDNNIVGEVEGKKCSSCRKYYRKHDIPSLSDEVWRLQNIRKGGKVEERLQDAKVCTVEDFLIQLLKDPQELKRNVNLGDKKWEATVNHARTCSFEERMYCYINFQQKSGIAHIDELLSSAFEHWKDVVPLQNKIELQRFTSFVTSGDPQDSFQPEHTNLHDKPWPSEMTGGKQLSSSLRGRGEPSVKEFSMDDVENVHNHPSFVPNPHTSFVTSGDPQDSFQSEHTRLRDKPGPSEMTGDKQLSSLRGRGEPSVKEFSMGDVEIVHNHPSFVPNPHTSLVTSVDPHDSVQPEHTRLPDKPGPAEMTGDKQLSSLRGRGEPSVKEFSMGDVEIVHNHPSFVPNPHTSLVTSVDPHDSVQPEHTRLPDKPGPAEMTGDKQLSSLRGRGEPSVKEFSMGDVEIVHNHPSFVPNPHTSLVTSVDPHDSVQPEHTRLHDKPGPSEMNGDKQFSSLRGRGEPSVKEFSMGDVEIVHNHPSFVPNPHTSLVTSVDPHDSVQPELPGLHDQPATFDEWYSRELDQLYSFLGEPSVNEFSIADVENPEDYPIHSPGLYFQDFAYFNQDFQNDNDYMESDKPL
ncbi:calmodulin-binding protein 60 A [Forsythia ovata]|uniref:Calmodulin-binding protein 60 A n=1 Tax=Forsythia ovata TaxID=205694 RepID=A0ABD1R2A7_9LAMI